MGSKYKAGYQGGSVSDNCEDLEDDQPLNSPNVAVIQKLVVDEWLNLQVDESDKPPRVLARTVSGEIAGAITSPKIGRLIACMRQGHRYQAVVITKTERSCVVRFLHRPNK